MKSLPNVTLISYDNTDHPLRTLRALKYSMRAISFAAVILVCRSLNGIKSAEAEGITAHFVTEQGYAPAMIWEVAEIQNSVTTDFALCVHHDGYIINPHRWDDLWLDYDFIGAPWPGEQNGNHPGKANFPNARVGNTGFCLKSRGFIQQSAQLKDLFVKRCGQHDAFGQIWGADTFLCQYVRPMLESRGIRYAPVDVAAQFAWESNIEEVPGDRPYAFGFHNFALENKDIPRA